MYLTIIPYQTKWTGIHSFTVSIHEWLSQLLSVNKASYIRISIYYHLATDFCKLYTEKSGLNEEAYDAILSYLSMFQITSRQNHYFYLQRYRDRCWLQVTKNPNYVSTVRAEALSRTYFAHYIESAESVNVIS